MSLARPPSTRIANNISKWMSYSPNFQFSTRRIALNVRQGALDCPACRGRVEGSQLRRGRDRNGNAISTRQFSHTLHAKNRERHDTSELAGIASVVAPPDTTSSSLPSHKEKRRSAVSKRMTRLLDGVLARASVASQHINVYTGTDYSGIEALRREIVDQEQTVRDCHSKVEGTKANHHDAVAEQASAQREVVSLLERKSSWSPSDLERYMSLVRSEHDNDHAVQSATEALTTAERDLEFARSLLERLERKQYHEEQIWSDTIRRNSTWLTFGLMGANILLLLAQIAIFEPYRRRRIVRDVKLALDERSFEPLSEVQKQIDTGLKEMEPKTSNILDTFLSPRDENHQAPLAASKMLPGEAADFDVPVPTPDGFSVDSGSLSAPTTTLGSYRECLRDLFSDRQVEMRMADVTNTALQGAATGVAVMGMLFLLLRPR